MSAKTKFIENTTKMSDAPTEEHALGRHKPPAKPQNAVGFAGVQQTAGNLAVQNLLRAGAIQAKLRVSQPGDADEQEANRVAKQVVSSGSARTIQRKCAPCAEGATCPTCEEEEEKVQTKEKPGHTPHFESKAASQITALRGGGQPLPPSVRGFFEPRFGWDFSGVRVHTEGGAAESARAIQARAFTTGQDVVFGAGEYVPESREGQILLAHELVHVVQQGAGFSAERVQHQGDVPSVTPGATATPLVVQRQAMPEEEEDIQTKADPRAVIQREEMPEEEEPLPTKIDPMAVIQRQQVPEEEPLQTPAEPGAWIQRQDDGSDTGDVLAPPAIPSVSGTAELTSLDGGDPYHDEAFGKWRFDADGLTTADFLAPTFTTKNEKESPAKGCDGCDDKDCFNITATATITFKVNINVNLPSGSDFTDMKECEQRQIQDAIDTILKPHEQKHVAAFSTYNGTIAKPVQTKACRADAESGAALTTAAKAIANVEGSKRSATARAASEKLDPFVVDVDLKECQDKQSVGPDTAPADVAYA